MGNLLISISILCFVSLVAGTPASGGVKADVAGEPLEKRRTARMLFGSALGARKTEEANRQADERLLKDYAKVEISRDNRETCIKEGEECSMESDNCCSGLKCDWPVSRIPYPVCEKPYVPNVI